MYLLHLAAVHIISNLCMPVLDRRLRFEQVAVSCVLAAALWGMQVDSSMLLLSDCMLHVQVLYLVLSVAGGLLRLWAMRVLARHFTFEVGIVKDHK